MKAIIRFSVFGLVLAGAVASGFSSSSAPSAAPHNNMVVSAKMPVPVCEPGNTGCGLP